MTASIPHRTAMAFALLVLGSTILRTAAATAEPAANSGDLWDTSSKISMEGMPMELPAQKATVCASKDWSEPPGGADQQRQCTNSDFKVDGSKVTWNVKCAGPPPMTGNGEITRAGRDAYSGAIKFTSSEVNMTVKLDGRRLGDCELPKK
jgi:hypothetical protein